MQSIFHACSEIAAWVKPQTQKNTSANKTCTTNLSEEISSPITPHEKLSSRHQPTQALTPGSHAVAAGLVAQANEGSWHGARNVVSATELGLPSQSFPHCSETAEWAKPQTQKNVGQKNVHNLSEEISSPMRPHEKLSSRRQPLKQFLILRQRATSTKRKNVRKEAVECGTGLVKLQATVAQLGAQNRNTSVLLNDSFLVSRD